MPQHARTNSQTYAEMVCIPTDCCEIFADFIVQITGEALEEIATSTLADLSAFRFYNVSQDDRDSMLTAPRVLPRQALVIRSLYDPSSTPLRDYACGGSVWIDDESDNLSDKTLVQALESFACVVSQRLGRKVGFAYAVEHKSNQDWIALYQAGVTPLECGRFYIRPSWHLPKVGRENIVIDPALAFGSGHHASTFMCISLLSAMNLANKHCLDVGCGSGILGIIMAKQGGIVSACDVDMLAVEETRKNFTQNGVSLHALWQGSITTALPQYLLESTFEKVDSSPAQWQTSASQGGVYDVICANIVADVLACMRNDFIAALKPSGVLILSGILAEKCEWILEIFGDMQLLQKEQKDEWVSLKFALVI